MPKIKVEGLKSINPNGYSGKCSRSAPFSTKNKTIDWEKGIETIVTTDAPAIVVDWRRWELVREVLLIEGAELPETGKTVLLDTHSAFSVEKVKGSEKDYEITEHQLLGRTIVSETEDKIRKKIEEGHIDSVSVGYETYKNETIEIPKGKEVNINGRNFKNDYDDDKPFLVRTKWKVLETSLVPIGADERARLKKSLADTETLEQEKNNPEYLDKKESITIQGGEMLTPKKEDGSEVKKQPEKTPDEIRAEERKRIADIEAVAKKFNLNPKDAIANGISVDAYKSHVVDTTDATQLNTSKAHDEMDGTDAKQYNLANLIEAAVTKNPAKAAHELKRSEDIADQLGVPASRGVYVDMNAVNSAVRDLLVMNSSYKAVTVGGDGTAGALIDIQSHPNLFLDVLHNKMVIGNALNAKMMPNCVGPQKFTRKTATSTAYYIGEEGAASESNPDFGFITKDERELSAKVRVSRKTRINHPNMMATLMDDIITQLGLRGDRAFLEGPGTDEEPLGILLDTAVQTIDASNFNYDKAVDFETALEDANIDSTNAKWLTKPTVRGQLRKLPIESGHPDKMIERLTGKMLDREVFASKQFQSTDLALATGGDLYAFYWGVMEWKIELEDNGFIKIIPFLDHNVLNRTPIGIVKGINFSIAP